MSLKKGSMTTAQLREYFGEDAISDNGRFVDSAMSDKYINDDKLKDFFTGELGRNEGEWNDKTRDENDISTIVRELHKDSGDSGDDDKENEPTVHSPKLAMARARAQTRELERTDGSIGRRLYGGGDEAAGGSFLDKYVLNLGERLSNGYYVKNDATPTNDSQVAGGANSQSLDAAYYAKTGKDTRLM